MSAALRTPELPPEALALIKEGTPKPQVQKESGVAGFVSSDEVSSGGAAASVAETETARIPRPRAVQQREFDPAALAGVAHVSVRLPTEIPQALLRASLDRKLNRIKPWTQQDIVALALSAWLKREGYLGNAKSNE